MQSSLPTEPADQNIKAVDPAEFGEIAKIVDITTPRNIGLPSHSKREDLGYPIRFELSLGNAFR
jgi:hypothetical protein